MELQSSAGFMLAGLAEGSGFIGWPRRFEW